MLTQALKVGLLLTIALAVGCGDSNGTPNTDAGQTGTIVDVAVGNDDFSICLLYTSRCV